MNTSTATRSISTTAAPNHTKIPLTALTHELRHESAHSVRGISFTKLSDHTNFDSEYAIVGNDIVIHLFHPYDREHHPTFWQKQLAAVLDRFAQEFWEATYPRLMAAYTEDLDSWWFKAIGFASQGDPEARCIKFLNGLDRQLDAIKN